MSEMEKMASDILTAGMPRTTDTKASQSIEYCSECGIETGHAGLSDDSSMCEICHEHAEYADVLCNNCLRAHQKAHTISTSKFLRLIDNQMTWTKTEAGKARLIECIDKRVLIQAVKK